MHLFVCPDDVKPSIFFFFQMFEICHVFATIPYMNLWNLISGYLLISEYSILQFSVHLSLIYFILFARATIDHQSYKDVSPVTDN